MWTAASCTWTQTATPSSRHDHPPAAQAILRSRVLNIDLRAHGHSERWSSHVHVPHRGQGNAPGFARAVWEATEECVILNLNSSHILVPRPAQGDTQAKLACAARAKGLRARAKTVHAQMHARNFVF